MRFFVLLLGVLLAGMQAMAQYPELTIREIQEVPLDSLIIADSLQNISEIVFQRFSCFWIPYGVALTNKIIFKSVPFPGSIFTVNRQFHSPDSLFASIWCFYSDLAGMSR